MKNKINAKLKIESRNNNNFGYKTDYTKSESINNNKNNNDYINNLYHLDKKNLKKQYKYNKLFSYSKEKIFLKEIKKFKDTKKKINSNKMNQFHQIFIFNKMKSFSDSPDNIDLTSNNKTTTLSSATTNNFTRTKFPFLKSTNFLHYSSNSNKTRNKVSLNINSSLKTENNIIYNSTTINNGFSILKSKKGNKNNIFSISNILSNKNKKISFNLEQNNFENSSKNRIIFTSEPATKVLNYKFNDAIGNIDNNVYCEGKLTSFRGIRNGLTEQILSKFKFNIINRIKKEFYKTQFEIQQNPLNFLKEYEIFQETNKKYYFIYQILIKKYFGYLYNQVDEEKYKLMILNEEREKLKEENFQLLKKINNKNEKLLFYQNFLKLLMKIKYNTNSLDKLSNEYLTRYGIKVSPLKTNESISLNKKFLKRFSHFLITETKDKNRPKLFRKTTKASLSSKNTIASLNKKNNYNEINKSNKDFKRLKSKENSKQKINLFYERKKSVEYKISKKVPIFKDVEELFERLKGIDNHLKDLYKESSDKRYMIQILKTELYKEKGRIQVDKNLENNNIELEYLKEELKKIKSQNLLYINCIKFLNDNKNNNYIEYKPKIADKHTLKENITDDKDEKKKKVNFADKLISILLQLKINIEEFIDCPGIYSFLKSPQEIKINNQGREYMKILFCIKIIEIIFLKLMEKRREYLSNNKTRNHYLELEEIMDRNNKLNKIYEKREEEIKQRIKKEKEILIKSTKVPILPIKKDDPFSYNIYFEQFKKKEKERLKILKKNEQIDAIFNNFISY